MAIAVPATAAVVCAAGIVAGLQAPDPGLIKELGLTGYLLLLMVVSGIAALGWFLRRMADAADSMASRLDAAVQQLPALRVMLSERLERLEQKLDWFVALNRLQELERAAEQDKPWPSEAGDDEC